MNPLLGAGTVGLVVAQGGVGVVAGVVEAAGVQERNCDVALGPRGAIEIASRPLVSDGLAVVMQGAIQLAADAAAPGRSPRRTEKRFDRP